MDFLFALITAKRPTPRMIVAQDPLNACRFLDSKSVAHSWSDTPGS